MQLGNGNPEMHRQGPEPQITQYMTDKMVRLHLHQTFLMIKTSF